MTKVNFIPCHPDHLPFKALDLIKNGLTKAEGNLQEILGNAANNKGSIYLLESEGIKGVFYFEVYQGILNLALMSCEDVMKYREEISFFVKNLMRENGIENFCIVSRTGWHRLFKDLTPVGMIYTMRVVGGT